MLRPRPAAKRNAEPEVCDANMVVLMLGALAGAPSHREPPRGTERVKKIKYCGIHGKQPNASYFLPTGTETSLRMGRDIKGSEGHRERK